MVRSPPTASIFKRGQSASLYDFTTAFARKAEQRCAREEWSYRLRKARIAADPSMSRADKLRHLTRLSANEATALADREEAILARAALVEGEHDKARKIAAGRRLIAAIKASEDSAWDSWGYTVFAPWRDVGVWQRVWWVHRIVVVNMVVSPVVRGGLGLEIEMHENFLSQGKK